MIYMSAGLEKKSQPKNTPHKHCKILQSNYNKGMYVRFS